MEHLEKEHSAKATWLWIFILSAFILAKGYFTFFVVGNTGLPSWDYRNVKYVPGESPYAIYKPLPYPQHVRGEKGE